jgi:hypothetical protein
VRSCCCTGRLHFFFPDSRLALDLNTDKTLKVDLTLLIHISMLQWNELQPQPSQMLQSRCQ